MMLRLPCTVLSLINDSDLILGAAEGGASEKCVLGPVVRRILSVRRRRGNFERMQRLVSIFTHIL